MAQYYLTEEGPFTDQQTYDVSVEGTLDDGSSLNVDDQSQLNIAGTNNVTTDSFGNELNNLQLIGTAVPIALPTLTPVSPSGSITTTNGLLTVEVQASSASGIGCYRGI